MEPLAVIGIGCRFAQAPDPEAFWRLLAAGAEAIEEVPPDRWDVDALYDPSPATPGKTSTRWGSWLADVDKFDADFFAFSAFEAERMDPQQRIMLEVTWEALENAGIVPATLAGGQTGVFLGISHSDYDRLIYKDLGRISPIHGISTYHCIAANRVSYVLDLRGPSLAIDTACSSTLVALHYACLSLRADECDIAIVGGVNLMLSPEETIGLSKSGMMAPDGRCKTFDESANGYVRGDGCGVLILKREADAQAANDRILARVRGSAVNQGGLTNGLGAPSGPAQQALIRQALKASGVEPSRIGYVEAQGLGTSLGDQTEIRALKTVVGAGRGADAPCYVGSVKTNVGHLEAASGAAGLIKVILALQHDWIPPHRNLNKLNPHIALQNTPFVIPTEGVPWPATNTPRIAAVTAIGFGGTNCQVIVEEGSRPSPAAQPRTSSWQVLTLSAKHEAALRDLAAAYEAFLANDSATAFADIAFTTNTARTHFDYRLAIAADTPVMARAHLQAFLRGAQTMDYFSGHALPRARPKIAFVFEDRAVDYKKAWRELYPNEPAFRDAFDACEAIFQRYRDGGSPQRLADAFERNDGAAAAARFAVPYALAVLWQHWGVTPAAVIGTGVGEYAAACIAQSASLEDALRFLLTPTAPDVVFAAPAIPALHGPSGKSLSAPRQRPTQGSAPSSESPMRAPAAEGIANFLDVSSGRLTVVGSQEVSGTRHDDALWTAATMVRALAQLYVLGAPIGWSAVHRGHVCHKVALPTYRFQRRRYWFDPKPANALASGASLAGNSRKPPAFDAIVVELQNGRSDREPLFLVHPVQGSVLCYHDLVRRLGSDRPVYGLQAPDLGGATQRFASLEAMASVYRECVRHVQPTGTLHLAGWSMGGAIAFEMAQQLRRDGETARIALIDTRLPDAAWIDGGAKGLLVPMALDLGVPVDALDQELLNRGDLEHGLRHVLALANGNALNHAGDSAALSARVDLLRRHIELLRGYEAQPYDQPVIVFRAQAINSAEHAITEDLGWRARVSAVTVHPLPGDHFGILREPTVVELAEALRRDLLTSAPVGDAAMGYGAAPKQRRHARELPSAVTIEQWSVAWLAHFLGADTNAIDPQTDFTHFGLNSISAVRFLKELGDWLGITVTPAIVWKYRTLRALSEYLASGGPETEPVSCASIAPADSVVEGAL